MVNGVEVSSSTSSSSTTSTMHRLHAHQLAGAVNTSKLDDVLEMLCARLDANTHTIESLRRDVATRVSMKTFREYTASVNERLTGVDARCRAIEERLARLEGSALQSMQHHKDIKQLFALANGKVARDEMNKYKHDTSAYLAQQLKALDARKANLAVVANVEQSQQDITREIIALQNVMACKIDRVEVPLLRAASDRLEALTEFQTAMTRETERLSARLDAHDDELDKKEDVTAATARMTSVQRLLDMKSGREETVKLTEQTSALADQVKRWALDSEILQQVVTEQSQLVDTIGDVDTRLAAAAASLDTVATQQQEWRVSGGDELTTLREWLQTMEQRGAADWSSNAAYLTGIRNELIGLKSWQNDHSEKMEVAMRFVDWFTNVKLKNKHCHHV